MRTRFLVIVGFCIAATGLLAIPPGFVLDTLPIDRVVTNLERMIVADPGSVEIRVNLARLHSMAYARKVAEVETFRTGSGTNSRFGQGQPYFGWGAPHIQPSAVIPASNDEAAAAAKAHLIKAIAEYRAALERAPRHLVAQIGLGWTLKEAGDKSGAITALRRAVELGWEVDRDPNRFRGENRSVTQEAAFYLTQLLDPINDKAELATIRNRVTEISKRPLAISPIAVPLRAGVTAEEMIDNERFVTFDLDGSGIPRKWTWLSKDAAWLVHDHRGSGRITSALQLFGNVTFWAFWENGYRALRAMDDDGDGEVDGRERIGLSLWHDRNSNGISDRGEVRTLIDWGIASLSTSYEYDASHQHEIAWSPSGVRFESGEVRPTYDLVMTTGRR